MRPSSLAHLTLLTALIVPAAGAQQLDADRILSHIRYLADDRLAGREAGEPGADSAAAYIESEFLRYGLKPLFEGASSYRQAFDVATTVHVEPTSKLILQTPEQYVGLRLGTEWYPFSYSTAGEVNGRARSVGYGLQASDFDTLKSSRATIAIIDGSTPDEWNPHSGPDASLRRRATLAREAGVKAVLIIVDELDRPQIGDIPKPLGIPVVQIVRKQNVLTLIADQYLRVSLTADVTPVDATLYNVGGIIRGADRQGRVIVLGAHYDHLGFGGPGSLAPDTTAPHNGADDNASGTALLLELARYYSRQPAPPVSLAFVSFTAEEMGLIGSNYFVTHAPIGLDSTAAMLNFDMVGRVRDGKLQIFGTETAAEFSEILDAASAASDLKVSRIGDGYGPSDQTSFYAHRVPVLHFFSGTHSQYHRPEDDWNLINADGIASVGRFVIDVVGRLATRSADLTYVAQKRPQSSVRRGYGPYLGTIPDFSPVEGGGLAISGVRPGSPAEQAGLTGGDVVIRFDNIEVTSIEDYAVALRDRAPGDTVSVRVRRGGAVLDLEAVLGKR